MTKKQRGRKRGKRSKAIQQRVARLLDVIEGNYINRTHQGKYWNCNELTTIACEDEYVTESKKRKMRYALGLARAHMLQEHGVELYSVKGEGYCILDDPEDYKAVFESGWLHSSGRLKTLRRLWEKGNIEALSGHLIESVNRGQLEDAKAVIYFLESQTDRKKQYAS